MFGYISEAKMPWAFASFGTDVSGLGFNIPGIPTLIVLRGNGSLVTEKGREDVMAKGVNVLQSWMG